MAQAGFLVRPRRTECGSWTSLDSGCRIGVWSILSPINGDSKTVKVLAVLENAITSVDHRLGCERLNLLVEMAEILGLRPEIRLVNSTEMVFRLRLDVEGTTTRVLEPEKELVTANVSLRDTGAKSGRLQSQEVAIAGKRDVHSDCASRHSTTVTDAHTGGHQAA